MLLSGEPGLPVSDTVGWRQRMAPYQRPHVLRAMLELGVTAAPLAALWAAMIAAVQLGLYWLYPLLLIFSAGFLVRLFMVQHDCGHAAFFPSPIANDWTGRLIGVLTLTPYDHWRRSHALHHATSGDLDRRGAGDIDTLTVDEYLARSWWGRARYRLYRHPFVMFGVGPAYIFLLQNRLPIGFMRKGWMPWLSTMSTNLGVAALAVAFIAIFGWLTFALTYVAMALLAGRGRLAVLRAAPILVDPLGASGAVERQRGCAARQLALRSADGAAVVQRQHRRAPRPSSVEPHSLLSPARGVAGLSGIARARPPDAGAEPRLPEAGVMGRDFNTGWCRSTLSPGRRVSASRRTEGLKKTHFTAICPYRYLAQCLGPLRFETNRVAHDNTPDIDKSLRTLLFACRRALVAKGRIHASRRRQMVQRPEGLWLHPA